jgi:A/G-specific adenine glycosylase
MITNDKKYFTSQLLLWNQKKNRRMMPWKGEKDPYRVWLSEIILQQTRVEQGWDYYDRFIDTFPTVDKLAKAPETTVFKLWEGLGYYTRCKNLIATAKLITKEYGGKFPDSYEAILALKGVGPYTAAAIASFAFNLPHAVVDGNVFRVLSRYFGISVPTDSTEGKKMFTHLAAELLDKKQPGIYNQAIMDLGAIVCKPKLPLCSSCPLNRKCIAYLNGLVNSLPVKEKSIVNTNRWLYYFVVEHNGKLYVRKRQAKDIWQNLYEFVLYEHYKALTATQLKKLPFLKELVGDKNFTIVDISGAYRQQLTHQTIEGRFIRLKTEEFLVIPGYKPVSAGRLRKLPFPKFITGYLTENREKAFER